MAQRAPSIAEAMYPSLRSNSPEAKAREAGQAQQAAQAKWHRDMLLRNLRELNARVDERLRREGR